MVWFLNIIFGLGTTSYFKISFIYHSLKSLLQSFLGSGVAQLIDLVWSKFDLFRWRCFFFKLPWLVEKALNLFNIKPILKFFPFISAWNLRALGYSDFNRQSEIFKNIHYEGKYMCLLFWNDLKTMQST